jgi:hypothetical protein
MKFFVATQDGIRLASVGDRPVIVGRGENSTVRLEDSTVSRAHCIIYRINDEVWTGDLGGGNATFLDGERIQDHRRWTPEQQLTVGRQTLRLELEEEPEVPATDDGEAGATQREESESFSAASVGLMALIVWLIVSQAVLFDQLLGSLRPLRSVDATMVDTPQSEIAALRAELGSDDVPRSDEFENRLSDYIAVYETSPDFAEAVRRREALLPGIIEVLDEYHVPRIFSVLPIVESFFLPRAWNRRTDARGLWQFRSHTAREYGLTVRTNRDDRLDPVASTKAAARYLQDLLAVLGPESVSLAAAAYNAGDGTVRYALRKIDNPSTDRTYWHLVEQELLPVETRQYVLRLFAAAILVSRWDGGGFSLR